MNAFISYSHANTDMVEILHKHLAQLKRTGTITTWTDNQIDAGSRFDSTISTALANANIFIALLSSDYLASTYCYDIEFKEALNREQAGSLIIVPVILDPCDWLNTPFKQFKALPKDGKAVSVWSNINTAFVDITQNLRSLVTENGRRPDKPINPDSTVPLSRNYRVKKEFDSIQKMEFVEKTFEEVIEHMRKYISEVIQIDNVKARILNDQALEFKGLLVNRNISQAESELDITIASEKDNHMFIRSFSNEKQLIYSLKPDRKGGLYGFTLSYDDYDMFWTENINEYGQQKREPLNAKTMADKIWDHWLESVGIL